MILKRASEFLNQQTIDKLEQIIQPWYLGCDSATPTSTYEPKTILYNHRRGVYTGSEFFFEVMDELWETRKDFQVWTTLKEMAVKLGYVTPEEFDAWVIPKDMVGL